MFGKVFDLEADGLNPTKIHCIIHEDDDDITSKAVEYFSKEEVWVGHNIIRFDIPVLKRLLRVTPPPESTYVDTLALCWYLWGKPSEVGLRSFGLEAWGEHFGVAKPVISDWEGLDRQEYLHRCREDVKINKLLWQKQYKELRLIYKTDDKILALCRYLAFKMKCARLQEESRWKLDIDHCRRTIEKFEELHKEKVDELRRTMPKVPITAVRNPPAKLYKADGELSEVGRKWRQLLASKGLPPEHGLPVEVITGYDEPNPQSHDQIKEWLYSLGWIPRTFKTNKKGEEVPQLNRQKQDGGGLCESITEMVEDHPELDALDGFFVLGHRLGVLRGFLRDVSPDGYLTASVAGFTNTLRFKHSEIVNLPKPDAKFGKEIRQCLIADDGYELVGADMSSLEDRTKQHYMYPHDPEYVEQMSTPDFDPHLDLALSDGALTKEEVDDYKKGSYSTGVKTTRGIYKNGNYSCTYGAGAPKIAKTIGGSLEQGKRIHSAFWKRNWSLKKIADLCTVRSINGRKWIYNPVSTFWYPLRNEKDRFSTLNQSTGVFCFDVWVSRILERRPQLTAQFHDEVVLEVKKGFREEVREMLQECIDETNQILSLNRSLDIGIEFGNNYAEVH